MKTLSFAKTSSLFKPIKSFIPFKGNYVAVIITIQLSKHIRLIGACVETESARAIRAQTAPVGWLIPYVPVNSKTAHPPPPPPRANPGAFDFFEEFW